MKQVSHRNLSRLIAGLLAVAAAVFGIGLANCTASPTNLDLQDQIGELGAQIAAEESDTFAGLHIEQEPGFRVVIQSTDPEGFRIEEYTDDPELLSLIEVLAAAYSLAELEQARAGVAALATRLGIEHHTSIDIRSNRTLLIVKDVDVSRSRLERAGEMLPPNVKLISESEIDEEYSGYLRARTANKVRVV